MKILILNGPNLNLLGRREPDIYGSRSFESYFDELTARFPSHQLLLRQSNSEGTLIDILHSAAYGSEAERVDAVVFNAGAYTHYSIALADAIAAISPLPVVEVHISNVQAREEFRRQSVIGPVCRGTIAGFGLDSYRLAIEALLQ